MQLKKHTHEERLEIARQLCEQILKTYGNKVLAICIVGSTAKKLDRPYSDLEMVAVTLDGIEIPAKKYIYDGIVIDIEYFQQSSILKDARRITFTWALAADQYRNRITLYDPTDWISKLDKVVAEADAADTHETVGQLMASLFEGLEVIKNAELLKDEIGVRTGGFYLAWDAAMLVLLMNRRFILTSSWFWKETEASPVKPMNFWTHAEILTGFARASVNTIFDTAELLCNEMLKIVESLGISIEPEKLLV